MVKQIVLKDDLSHILNVSATPLPTGNIVGRGHFVIDPNKDKYFVDIEGNATLIEAYTLTTEWKELELLNGFVAYAGDYTIPRYRVLKDVLHVQGLAKGGATGKTIAVLPAEIADRLGSRSIHTTDCSGTTNARLDVKDDGSIVGVAVNTSWTSLEFSRALD